MILGPFHLSLESPNCILFGPPCRDNDIFLIIVFSWCVFWYHYCTFIVVFYVITFVILFLALGTIEIVFII